MNPEKIFYSQTTDIFPKPPSEKQRANNTLNYLKYRQKEEIFSVGAENVTKKIFASLPVNILVLGDLHIGSMSTDYGFIENLKKQILDDKQTYAFLLGDIIDGFKPEYHDTQRSQLTINQQIRIARERFLMPLSEKGKILAAGSDHFAHEGWAQKQSEINIWELLVQNLDIPLLRQGGKLTVVFKDGKRAVLELHHSVRGKSKVEAIFGLREIAKKITASKRADAFFSGHVHESAVGKELYPGLNSALVLVGSGTTKGINKDLPPDNFGMRAGFGLAEPLGQSVIIRKKGDGQIDLYPIEDLRSGGILFKADKVLEKVNAQGMQKELLGRIHAEVEMEPEIITDFKKSKPFSYTEKFEEFSDKKKDGDVDLEELVNPSTVNFMALAEQYQHVAYDIRTKLPIALHFISNVRVGSSYEGIQDVKKYLIENIANNPHSLAIFLRAMIDKDVAKNYTRLNELLRIRSLIAPISKQSLAILLDANLRQSGWKKEIVDNSDRSIRYKNRLVSPPIAPGSYLSNTTNTPLIHHKSLIKLTIGPKEAIFADRPIYIGAIFDKLEKSGSTEKPTFGLKQMYKKLSEKPSFVVGGHMPNSGFGGFYDRENIFSNNPILIAPGWWAGFVDTLGQGNVSEGAQPGQALILLPGSKKEDYGAIPTVNAQETRELHDALTLLYGLKLLGLTEKVMKLNGRKVSKKQSKNI